MIETENYKKTENYHILEHSKYFDSNYYHDTYPDITLDIDPIEHYLRFGWKEDRIPSKYFDPNFYLRRNLDVKKSNKNPLLHYIQFGQKEKRPMHRVKSKEVSNDLLDDYNILQESILFDEQWYLEEHNLKFEIDPFLHYLEKGVNLGFDPNPNFSTFKYLLENPDVKREGMNPLVHYIRFGQKEKRAVYESDFNNPMKKYSRIQTRQIIKALNKRITIIVPVYNAFDKTMDCIKSIFDNTKIDYELVIIDDNSTDKNVQKLLSSLKKIPNVYIIRNRQNQGFIKSVNKGILESHNDVVILNSDVITTPQWLSHLIIAAYTKKKIGIVNPVSNLSNIEIPELNESRSYKTIYQNGYKVNKIAINGNIESPTSNDFCMYVKRDVINVTGLFNENFGKGYGEDIDFTQRAKKKGWETVKNDSIFIYHDNHSSFKKNVKHDLISSNNSILKERYPNVFENFNKFMENNKIQKSVQNIKKSIDKPIKNRLLYITTTDVNHNPLLTSDYTYIHSSYDSYILSITDKSIAIWKHDEDISIINYWHKGPEDTLNEFKRIYLNLLINLKIDIALVTVPEFPKISHTNIKTLLIKMLNRLEIDLIYHYTEDKESLKKIINNKLSLETDSLEKIIEDKKEPEKITSPPRLILGILSIITISVLTIILALIILIIIISLIIMSLVIWFIF